MDIIQVDNDDLKMKVTREILESLLEWFEVPESREGYIADSAGKDFFYACDNGFAVGFLYLKPTSRHTVEIAVMGVKKEYHRRGIGRKLFDEARIIAHNKSYSFIQVKTVQMGKYEDYDRTNLFYQALGFKELEVFPMLWDEANPCQIYIMNV